MGEWSKPAVSKTVERFCRSRSSNLLLSAPLFFPPQSSHYGRKRPPRELSHIPSLLALRPRLTACLRRITLAHIFLRAAGSWVSVRLQGPPRRAEGEKAREAWLISHLARPLPPRHLILRLKNSYFFNQIPQHTHLVKKCLFFSTKYKIPEVWLKKALNFKRESAII